jgi:hypothetical protein
MTLDGILTMLRRQPFEPFRVVMSSGESYEVRRPELVMPMRTYLFVALPGGNGQRSDAGAFCSYLHIAQLQTLQPA